MGQHDATHIARMVTSDETPASRERVDQLLRIETPENAVLTYRLAGPSVRLLAYLIDFGARIAMLMIFSQIIGSVGFFLPGLSQGATMFLLFLIQWTYYPVFEGFLQGRTPGKMACGLRVIQDQGYPLTFLSALIRNLVRVVDSFPLYGVGLVSMLVAGRFRRLGDLVGRTLVVEERRISLPREPIILETISPLPKSEIGTYVPDDHTLSVIEQFQRRRNVLDYRRGHALASLLARSLAARLRYQGDPVAVKRYPMAFLARVYVTFQALREEEADDQLVRELRRRPVGERQTVAEEVQ